ncbi:uncharacterized protein EI97DRAFT_147355 [Westerdykella ornata]|uniref:Uncharacterized protein n=1 Tax=Westerdykella ornata TaxID=318751 RepID=A0A6A6JC93_WESOR|nr:uncharacterized protein EI97DRAFT_147355 [Westerdykella ornata]KAF2273618.1 hypothetical protein EI97DRAFT_147355 [Westerdykella ornata]
MDLNGSGDEDNTEKWVRGSYEGDLEDKESQGKRKRQRISQERLECLEKATRVSYPQDVVDILMLPISERSLPQNMRILITRILWGLKPYPLPDVTDYESRCECHFMVYLDHVGALEYQCRKHFGLDGQWTHLDILYVITQFYGPPFKRIAEIDFPCPCTREDFRRLLIAHFTLMHTMTNLQVSEGDDGLKVLLSKRFPRAPPSNIRIKLGKWVRARDFEVANLRIEWTDDLAEHLQLVDNTTIRIFHHISFLFGSKVSQNVYPAGLRHETMWTLALLFPRSDRKTQEWLEYKRMENGGVHPDVKLQSVLLDFAAPKHLQHYPFWRERLILLRKHIDRASPHQKHSRDFSKTPVTWTNGSTPGLR